MRYLFAIIAAVTVAGCAERVALPERTTRIAAVVRNDLCAGTQHESWCEITSNPGSIDIDLYGSELSIDKVRKSGEHTGLWGNADVDRMTKTRPLDGTQRSENGRVSWTYSKNRLQLVVTITDDTRIPDGA